MLSSRARVVGWVMGVLLLSIFAPPQKCWSQKPDFNRTPRQGYRDSSFSDRPAAPARPGWDMPSSVQRTRPQHSGGHHSGGHHHSHGHRHRHHFPGHWYGPNLWYDNYFVPGYGYYWQDSSYLYYLPPVVVPAETAFGPEAVQRFWGLDQPAANAPAPADPRPQRDLVLRRNLPAVAPAAIVDAKAKARALRLVELGDAKFREQRYHKALQQYKQAADADPGLPEAHFRQGHALVAVGQYPKAVEAYQQGLQLQPEWPRSDFRFAQLFADLPSQLAIQETLAAAAVKAPEDATLFFLIGVQLYFDGQRDRSTTFFRRAQQLDPTAPYLTPFLTDAAPGPQEF